MNRAPVAMPWLIITRTLPSMPIVVSENRPMMAKPMCDTDE